MKATMKYSQGRKPRCFTNCNLEKFRTIWPNYQFAEVIATQKIEMNMDQNTKTAIIMAYGPNKDEVAEKKDNLSDLMSETIENYKGRVILIGDLNGRQRNNNGSRLIDCCILNNLVITNNFYDHKDIHKFTIEVNSRSERTIIDNIY